MKYLSMAGVCNAQMNLPDCAFWLYIHGWLTLLRISTSTQFDPVIVTFVKHQTICLVVQLLHLQLGDTLLTTS